MERVQKCHLQDGVQTVTSSSYLPEPFDLLHQGTSFVHDVHELPYRAILDSETCIQPDIISGQEAFHFVFSSVKKTNFHMKALISVCLYTSRSANFCSSSAAFVVLSSATLCTKKQATILKAC